jgi:beta-glucanase (GH16 family)
MRGAQRNNPVLRGLAYSSGLINARGRFAQQYGYFEARMRWTLGKGIWPAFWLLPADGKWPPEIDVIEALGHQPSVIYSSLHPRGNPNGITKTVSITGTGADFHTYGVMWLPDRTDFYVDGQKSATLAATPDMARPMYPVVNLAIGGYWPKDPDQTTPLPAKLDVKFVRAWAFSDGMVPGGAPTGR